MEMNESITKHIGDLVIDAANANDFANLIEVTGHLDISADAQLPVLTTIGGHLDISADAQLPVLEIAYGVEGRLIAVKNWGLWCSTDYRFYAGCRGPLTKQQAIALSKKWEDQGIAQYFISFIKKIDDKSLVMT